MTTTTATGTCPECETTLTLPTLTQGETLTCPECMLTLRVQTNNNEHLTLEMIETQLRDWGQ